MTAITPAGAIIPGVTHHQADVNGTQLYYVPAGTSGFPVLLVHGWPGTWGAFRKSGRPSDRMCRSSTGTKPEVRYSWSAAVLAGSAWTDRRIAPACEAAVTTVLTSATRHRSAGPRARHKDREAAKSRPAGQGTMSPSAARRPPRHPAPERMLCEHGLADAYRFSRHSYSASIRAISGNEPNHTLSLVPRSTNS
jgi:hypothetical protein